MPSLLSSPKELLTPLAPALKWWLYRELVGLLWQVFKHVRKKDDMKTLASLWSGAVTVTEEAGVVKLNFNDSKSLGAGKAAGWLKVSGQASIVLDGRQDFDLLMGVIESHSPAALVPIEQGAQLLGDAAISKA